MGKGKKKDDKKPKAEAQNEASTSQAPMEIDQSSSQSVPPPVVSPPDVPEIEEESVGLGLETRTKKNRPKKKKAAPPVEASTAEPAGPRPGGPGPSGFGPPGTGPTGPRFPPQQTGNAPQPTQPPTGYGPPGLPPGFSSAGYPPSAAAPAQAAYPAQPPWQRPQRPHTAQQHPYPQKTVQQYPQPSAGPPQSAGPWQQQQPPQPMAVDPSPPRAFSAQEQSRGRGRGRAKSPTESRSSPMEIGTPISQSPAPVQQIPGSRSGPRPETICRFKIPPKIQGHSVKYKGVKLLVNYFPMKFKAIHVYRYDVSFRPDRPKKLLKTAYNAVVRKHFPQQFIAYDQSKNCYSCGPLAKVPEDGRGDFTVEVSDPNGKVITYEVSFKLTGIVDLGNIKKHMESAGSSLQTPSEEIQCVDVILRQGALDSYVKCGRQFFTRPQMPVDLTGGLEIWTGLFQSAIFTSDAFINVDVAHKGFPKAISILDHLRDSFRLALDRPVEQQRNREVENFKNFMKRLKVEAIVVDADGKRQKREFICNNLVGPPKEMFFEITRDNVKSRISVFDYFEKEKKHKLKYPNLNCVWVGPKEKDIYYPLEVLTVCYGQPLNKQLNEKQLSNMVTQAATPPDVRKRKIEEVARSMKYSQNPFFKKFGLEITESFLQVDAKIIDPPVIAGGDRQTMIPRRGVWQLNRVKKPEALESWGFLTVECEFNPGGFENVKNMLMDCGRQMGMSVHPPKMIEFNKRLTDLRGILGRAVESKLKFMLVVINGFSKDAYHRVKQVAERDIGIITQCVKDNTLSRRLNPQTMKNILLKLNAKMMGINHVIDKSSLPRCMSSGGLMVVGADVTHPSPDQANIPSIAAVTASMDMDCFIYNIELSIQTPKKEMIIDFEEMMYDHLKVYSNRNKALPRKIYVFRDGVSEGQFAEVMNCELTAIHRAFSRIKRDLKPEVLFLLVQKRHHTRFFLGNNNSANVEPGTCVDTHIVHPQELDFYLVSHQAIKGTARPTRYHAVCNDGKLAADEVEQLTYYLCHLYARCTRSVSYPTPTYYAHLACLRARSLTYGKTFDNKALEKSPQRLHVLEKMLELSRMFFV